MKKNACLLPLFLLFFMARALAQTVLTVPRNIEAAIIKGSRTNEGVPGKSYWQNGADYTIHVAF